VTTRVLECGDGARTALCLHGSGSRADRWAPALPLLAELGLHVYAIDYPGHGLAEKPAGYPYGSPAFAEVAADVVDQLGGDPLVLLGTSIGGHVAALVAAARPGRVASAVMIGAVGLVAVPDAVRPASSPITNVSLAGVRAKLEFLVFDSSIVTDDWVREESRINSSPGAEAALVALGRYSNEELNNDLVGDEYAALGIPTLLCWGANDRWIPPSVGYDVAKLLPDAPLCLVERAGHAPYYERPEAFVEVVRRFLEDPAAMEPGPFSV